MEPPVTPPVRFIVLPSAFAILWFLAAFLGLWGVSLAWRGLFGDPARGRRQCPACAKDVAAPAMACGACGFASARERDFRAARRNWWLTGLGVFALAGAITAGYCGEAVRRWTDISWQAGGRGGVGPWQAAALGVAAFGVTLGVWAWRGERSRGRRRCPRCWYDLAGVGMKCPECGHEAGQQRDLYRPRRRPKGVWLGLALILSSYAVWIAPRVLSGGWVAAIPTTAMIAGLPWWPNSVLFLQSGGGGGDDWTLSGRLWKGRIWRWQRWWLRGTIADIVRESDDPLVLGSALWLDDTQVASKDWARLLDIFVRGLGDRRAQARDVSGMWVRNLTSGDRRGSEEYGRVVGPHLELLLKAVDDPGQSVSGAAMFAIASLGEGGETGLAKIIGIAGDGSTTPMRRRFAGWAWCVLAFRSAEARRAAAEALTSGSPVLQSAAIEVFADLRYVNSPRGLSDSLLFDAYTRDQLGAVVRDGADKASLAAARVLVENGFRDDRTVGELLDQASGARPGRVAYLELLMDSGPAAGRHAAQIGALLADPSPDVRVATEALITLLLQDEAGAATGLVEELRDRARGHDSEAAATARRLLDLVEKSGDPE